MLDVNAFIDLLVKLNAPELLIGSQEDIAVKFKAWAALSDHERSFSVAGMGLGSLLLTSAVAQAQERIEQRQEAQGELLAGTLDQLAALREDVATLRAELAQVAQLGSKLDALLAYLEGAREPVVEAT